MASPIEWVKVVLGNWKTIVGIVTFLVSILGVQSYELREKEAQVADTQAQVAQVAEAYRNAYTSETINNSVINTDCSTCMNNHLREYHQ